MKPTLCRDVIYRSRTGDYSLAAKIIGTVGSLNPVGVERGHVPAITGEDRVHLVVFSPGLPPYKTSRATRAVIDPDQPLGSRIVDGVSSPAAGSNQFLAMNQFGASYAEYDIAYSDVVTIGGESWLYDGEWRESSESVQAPGTWAWPPRV